MEFLNFFKNEIYFKQDKEWHDRDELLNTDTKYMIELILSADEKVW